jgi:hypothetical protein
MRQLKVGPVNWQAERRRQVDDAVVRFCELQRAIVVAGRGSGGLAGGGGGRRISGTLREERAPASARNRTPKKSKRTGE